MINQFQCHRIKTKRFSFPEVYLFRRLSLQKKISEQIAPLPLKPKQIFFSGSFIWKLKAIEFQNTMDLHHDQRIWGKYALFALLLDIRLFLTITNLSTIQNDLHHWNGMTETIISCKASYEVYLAWVPFHSSHSVYLDLKKILPWVYLLVEFI